MAQLDLVKIQLDLEDILDACQDLLKFEDEKIRTNIQDMLLNIRNLHKDIVESLESLYDVAKSQDAEQFSNSFNVAFHNFESREGLKDPHKIDASSGKMKEDLILASQAAQRFLNRFQKGKIQKLKDIAKREPVWILRDDKLRETIREFYKECKEELEFVKSLLNSNIDESQNHLIEFLSGSEVRFKKIKEYYNMINELIK